MERSDWQLLDTPAQKAVATVSMILTSQSDLGIWGDDLKNLLWPELTIRETCDYKSDFFANLQPAIHFSWTKLDLNSSAKDRLLVGKVDESQSLETWRMPGEVSTNDPLIVWND